MVVARARAGSMALLLFGCGPSIDLPEGSGDGGGVQDAYRGLLRVAGRTLLDIDPETAHATALCELDGIGDAGTQSLAFTRDNRLYATYDQDALYEIDPCTCEAWMVGAYGYGGVAGILPDRAHGLWGIASDQDTFVRIDTDDGHASAIGSLQRDVTNQGATWSERDDTVWVLVGSGPAELYRADPSTGALAFQAAVGTYFSAVGFEYHPETGHLYACSSDGNLLTIDPETGTPTTIGYTGWDGCDNLAAPPMPMPRGCLP